MSTIYIVTSGSYSDYRIHSVFDTRDRAEKFIEYMEKNVSGYYGDDCNIEEWEINKYLSNIERGLKHYQIYYSEIENGDASIVENCEPTEEYEHCWKTNLIGRTIVSYRVHVWAKDKESALKIANEKRVQYLASGRANQ